MHHENSEESSITIRGIEMHQFITASNLPDFRDPPPPPDPHDPPSTAPDREPDHFPTPTDPPTPPSPKDPPVPAEPWATCLLFL
jgi:hypothetical protein